jgi:hypothetical protein
MFGGPSFRPATSSRLDPHAHAAYSDEVNAMHVDVARNPTDELDPDVLRAHLADTAQREVELRNRQQEQFNKLRARLRSLETESAITSAPVLQLRRKQQELLANKRYADAFEHMKTIKTAEKEVMTAHREEHRRVNEESVRKLLEDQANEREGFRTATEDVFAVLGKSFHATAATNETTQNAYAANAQRTRGAPGGPRLETRPQTWDTWGAAPYARGGYAETRVPNRWVDDNTFTHHPSGTDGVGVTTRPDDPTRSGVENRGASFWAPLRVGDDAWVETRSGSLPRLSTPQNVSPHPTRHGNTNWMRTIPDTWQATAVNARPRADPNAFPSFDRQKPTAQKNDGAATLENASRALLSAALVLVRGGHVNNDRVPFTDGAQETEAQAHGNVTPASCGVAPEVPESVPAAPTERELGAAAISGVSKDDKRKSAINSVTHARGAFLARSSHARGDDSEDDDMDDAPLALNDTQTRSTGGHVVPKIDFSRLDLRKANYERYEKRGGARDLAGEASPAPPSRENERGIQKFLKASTKVSALVQMRPGDVEHRKELGDTREDFVDEQRRAKNSSPPERTEATRDEQAKKTAAAKLLMRKASSARQVVAALTEKSPGGQQAVYEDASTDAAHTEPSSLATSTAASSPGAYPRKADAKAPSGATTQTKLAATTEQENVLAQVSKRQFTTEDFRNLFSYSRHGKYKQVTDLLKSGCPAGGRDKFGNSPLIIACQNGNARIVKALLRHGAGIDAQNKQGCSGLHYCISYGFNSLSDYLIAKGANDKLLNKLGLTPYEGIR